MLVGRRRCGELLSWAITSRVRVYVPPWWREKLAGGTMTFDERRNWKGDGNCVVCKVPETSDHIFFLCPLAKFIWACANEALHWGMAPSSMQELLEGWIPLGCRNYGVKITVLAGVLWTLWNVRDKMTMEGVLLCHLLRS